VFLTVTLNAAMDKTLQVANLQIGLRHRCAPGLVEPGGKGINVARGLKALGEPVIATGLAGGRTGVQIVDALADQGLLNDFQRIRNESRTTTVLVDMIGETSRPTEIVEYGPAVSDEECTQLWERFSYLLGGATTVVLSGSLPRRVGEDWYATAIREARRRGIPTVLDSEGQPLRLGVAAEPDLVAPNQAEAEELAGFEFASEADFSMGLDTIVGLGARAAIITRDSGCVALLREGQAMHRLVATGPTLDPISRAGSGDALLAGYLAARRAGRGTADALRQAVACGAASTQTQVAGAFDPREAGVLAAKVRVDELAAVSA
jgi:1-phosphofructokinase family hexose kinase